MPPTPVEQRFFNPTRGSIIEQFPVEVLEKILMLIEPIWLFQLEQAVPSVAGFLKSEHANLIWYQAVPSALYGSPEAYQSESKRFWKDDRIVYDVASGSKRIRGTSKISPAFVVERAVGAFEQPIMCCPRQAPSLTVRWHLSLDKAWTRSCLAAQIPTKPSPTHMKGAQALVSPLNAG
jgi:hypothetical protein